MDMLCKIDLRLASKLRVVTLHEHTVPYNVTVFGETSG